jgi:hypothetical protein
MSVEEFVVNTEKTIKKFNILSIIIDIVSVTLGLTSLFIIFNIDVLFPSMSIVEVYVGHSYQVLGYQVSFESIILLLSAFIISLPVTAIIHFKDTKLNAVRLIEEKNSYLKERLSTAYDNRHVNNVIVNDLIRNVSDVTVKLQPTTFLNMARIYRGVACLIIISLTFTYITVTDYRTDIKPPQELLDYFGDDKSGSDSDLVVIEEKSQDSGNNSEENLIGEPNIVVVEGKQVDLTLPPGAGTGFTQGNQTNNIPDGFRPSSAYDISLISSSIYSEKLPEGYESIIKQYFEKMAEK